MSIKHYLLLLFMLLLVAEAQSQDITKVKANYKNQIGVVISPAMIGYFNTKPKYTPFYSPAFTISLYLEYNRILTNKIWLTGGIGIFSEGYFNSVDLQNKVYNGPSSTYYPYSKIEYFQYDYNFSIYLKPKYVLADRKLLFYIGFSAQLNIYLTSMQNRYYYEDDKIINTSSIIDPNPYSTTQLFYGGVLSGLGYRYGRFLFLVEPEFKVNISSLSEARLLLVPYSLGINLVAYYGF